MMLLSVVVLSYNRPVQVERILKNFIGVASFEFNIIIKDDASPLQHEIKMLVAKYLELLEIEVIFHSNERNMGYDANLIDSFYIANSNYVFLLSDDDYVIGSKMDMVIESIKGNQFDFYFTPCNEGNVFERLPSGDYQSDKFSDLIYNSILFSGLVFRVSAVKSLALDHAFLSRCIYSQVYLAIALIIKNENYGVLPSSFLQLGGDGDNFFGKNESASSSDLLSDRKKVYSDLVYQQFLLKVVDKVSADFGADISQSFNREYSKRLISYGLKVRGKGFRSYLIFLKAYYKYTYRSFLVPQLSFFIIIFLPAWISNNIYKVGVKFLRKS